MIGHYPERIAMHKALTTILTVVAVLFISGSGAWAQSDLARIQNMLETSMARQTILTEDDVRVYLAHAESIYELRFDPSKVDEVINETGWSESRFSYVTTKMSVGMSLLLRPDDPRNASIPDFAKPSGAELGVIRRYQEDLARTMEAVQARHSRNGGSSS